jgi:hypothetical protein
MIETNIPGMTPGRVRGERLTKPCKCGRAHCLAVQHEDERPTEFRRRKFKNRSCASWWGNMYAPHMREARAKGARSATRARGKDRAGERGALVTSVAWLFTDSGRVKALRAAHGIMVP